MEIGQQISCTKLYQIKMCPFSTLLVFLYQAVGFYTLPRLHHPNHPCKASSCSLAGFREHFAGKKNLKSSSWGWLMRFAPLNKHRRGGCGSPGHFIYLTPEGPFGSRDIRSRLCAQKVFLCPEHSLSVICGCIYRCSSAASGGTDSFEEGKS